MSSFIALVQRSRAGRFASDTWQAARAVGHGFRGESLNLRAGNLTFISIFSLVPLFTVALALLQILHQERFQERLRWFLKEILSPGMQQESSAFLERFVTDADHWLPPDNFQEIPAPVVAHRTSPTNIGLALLASVAAKDFGYIGLLECTERTELTLATLRRLDRYHGHFYNWYDTTTLAPLHPHA